MDYKPLIHQRSNLALLGRAAVRCRDAGGVCPASKVAFRVDPLRCRETERAVKIWFIGMDMADSDLSMSSR